MTGRCPCCGASLLSDPDEPPQGVSYEDLVALCKAEGHDVDPFGRVDEKCAAWLLRLHTGTLRNQRAHGESPFPFEKDGRRVFYRLADLLEARAGE